MTKKQLLFSFQGRISRKQYWLGTLLNFCIFLVPMIIFAVFGAISIMNKSGNAPAWAQEFTSRSGEAIATLIILPFLVVGVWSSWAIICKRLHDLGFSGWFNILINICGWFLAGVPYLLITVIIGCIAGKPGANKYGPDPLEKTT